MSDLPADTAANLAAVIRESLDEIVQDWAASGSHTHGALDDLNPADFLNRVAERLERPERPNAPPQTEARPCPSSSAGPMVRSFASLRQLALRHIARRCHRAIEPAGLAEFDRAFDELMAQSLASAVDSLLHDFQVGDELQARYMSFLSHDLRGSLNGLMLMLEVMRRELAGHSEFAETTQDIQLMRKSVQETVSNMERYVQADRLRRHKLPVYMQAVELRPIVSRIVDELAGLAEEKQAELIVDLDDAAAVQADPELARVAILNLVHNAIRHGGSPIEISAGLEAGRCAIRVTDHGPGIAADRLAWLLDPARPAQFKEKGIGLTLANFAAQNIGGRIEGESAPGGPTTFRLILKSADARA